MTARAGAGAGSRFDVKNSAAVWFLRAGFLDDRKRDRPDRSLPKTACRPAANSEGRPVALARRFNDIDLYRLLRLANCFDIEGETLARAYRMARSDTAKVNAELEEFAAQFDP